MENNNDKSKIPSNFIKNIINKDLEGYLLDKKIHTRFPPEPNGYLHIGHAKSICLNFGLAKEYDAPCNLRFDDTNPVKEDTEYVDSIQEDIKWLGFDWEDRKYYASDYFEKLYEYAVKLIKKGKAFVCDLSADEIREFRGNYEKPGKESPYRKRTIEENLKLFEEMKNGVYGDGEKVLRAKIDMAAPNINMRDPVIYRIAKVEHHRTGEEWCIYPMYDFAHPLSDALENITHSICTLEFEDHRPLYDWFLKELEIENPPKQIEFARLNLTNTIMSKRHLRNLVEQEVVEGWDDPRMPTISGLRRRGYTPEAIKNFCEKIGVAKSNSLVDISILEHCIREDLKDTTRTTMAVLNPLKIIITNYPEGEVEYLDADNSRTNSELGKRKIPFAREIYIDREDFMEKPPKKFFRLYPGNEVRLKHAYFIKCEEVIKDENGNVIELRCTYDPETKSGTGFTGRKVKGTLHWVSAKHSLKSEVRLYDHLMLEDEAGENIINENSLKILKNCYIEESMKDVKAGERYQFMRHGFFICDKAGEKAVYNRIVSLKDKWKKIKNKK
ncbi:glutamine--tRNA ligase/YqeY domain fusion protein [Abyssisolibacter fermentans]|uniref:glutamine--tRNA ligase/YqeY domain fusion protein n=1 Tax=Abyssisolibacter fermentans TaxID=1766203 RepID=UPI0008360263|nr:glutamine--tRNA ligase/YqeY domain fusion protein [Abyssisolibacter fermentans]